MLCQYDADILHFTPLIILVASHKSDPTSTVGRNTPNTKLRLKANPYVPNANLSNLNDFPYSDVPGLV